MTQDDAHLHHQGADGGGADSLLTFVLELLRDYGLTDFYLELSTRLEGKASAPRQTGTRPRGATRGRGDDEGSRARHRPGGDAVYGPTISVQARDAIGRTWQMSTIQLDFQEPASLRCRYVGADNERHRPMMIHRALFGSVERFFAVLVEHYAGAFGAGRAPCSARAAGQPAPPRVRTRITDRLTKADGFRVTSSRRTSGPGGRIRNLVISCRGLVENLTDRIAFAHHDLRRQGQDCAIDSPRFRAQRRDPLRVPVFRRCREAWWRHDMVRRSTPPSFVGLSAGSVPSLQIKMRMRLRFCGR